MKRQIPAKDEDDVLYTFWLVLSELESKVDCGTMPQPFERQAVVAAYNVLNRIGYTTARPAWETRAAAIKAPSLP